MPPMLSTQAGTVFMKQVVRTTEPVCARWPGGSRHFLFLHFFFLSEGGMCMNDKAFVLFYF